MTDKELIAEAIKAYEDVFNVARRERDLIRRLAEVAELHALCDDRLWGVEKHAERMEAERDAAVAAIERVRELVEEWRYGIPEYTSSHYQEGQKDQQRKLVGQLLAALDGVPEPEWEYAVNMGWGQNPPMIQWVTDSKDDALADIEGVPRRSLVRRRKAGPWLPVEGESKP